MDTSGVGFTSVRHYSVVDVSVVIVSKNEEKRIRRCIQSVLDALSEIPSHEVILVDSSSTDDTVAIASSYPIKIVQLKPHWKRSPAAGMFTGYTYTKGRLVCFIGGDMEIDHEWFKTAIPYLKSNSVAGVTGRIRNKFEGCPKSRLVERRINRGFELIPVGEVEILGGPSMLKRNVLQEVGCFHPFLEAGEEAELSMRIRTKGYKLLRLDFPMVNHISTSMSLFSYISKYGWKYVLALGSCERYSISRKEIPISRRLRPIVISLLLTVLVIFTIASLLHLIFTGDAVPFALAFVVYSISFTVTLVMKRNLEDTVFSVLGTHVRSLAMLIGFLHKIPNPDTYPKDVIVVKEWNS